MSRKKAPEDAAGQPWLDALEAGVQDAVERLTALAAENRRLGERVAELEARLKAAGSRGDAPAGDTEAVAAAEAGGEGAAAWRRERDQVRRRVGRLVETLERLLDERDS